MKGVSCVDFFLQIIKTSQGEGKLLILYFFLDNFRAYWGCHWLQSWGFRKTSYSSASGVLGSGL